MLSAVSLESAEKKETACPREGTPVNKALSNSDWDCLSPDRMDDGCDCGCGCGCSSGDADGGCVEFVPTWLFPSLRANNDEGEADETRETLLD